MKPILTTIFLLTSLYGFGQKALIVKPTHTGGSGNGSAVWVGQVDGQNYNAQADTLFKYMTVHPTNTRKALISKVIDTLVYYAIWDSLDMFYEPKAHDVQAAKLDWKTPTRVLTVVDSMYFLTDLGFLRNYKNGYINTNYNPRNSTQISVNNAFYGIYLKNAQKYASTGIQIGTSDGSNYITTQVGINGAWNNHVVNGSANIALSISSTLKGLFILGRYRADSISLYKGTTRTPSLSASSNTPNKDIYLNAWNSNGTTLYPTRNVISTAFASSRLSSLQVSKLNEILIYYESEVDAQRTETVWSNSGLDAKLVNKDEIGYGLTILYQKEGKKLLVSNDTIYLSLNNGVSYPYKKYHVDAKYMNFAVMYSNNSILLTTNTKKLYVSYDSLQTVTERTLKAKDNTNYVYHTPAGALYPGNYFEPMGQVETFISSGRETLVWGPYCNDQGGASPVNVYASTDTLKTIKVIYSFGVDSSYRDNGSSTPSALAGNYLGDATNPIVARHVHSTLMVEDTVYVATGDSWPNSSGQNEIRWLKGVYNSILDTFTFTTLVDYTTATYFKSVGLSASNDTIYWGSDGAVLGIYKCKAAEITNLSKHVKLYTPDSYVYEMQANNGEFLALVQNKMLHSIDYGQTWDVLTLVELVPTMVTSSRGSLRPKDSSGWYSIWDRSYPKTNALSVSILFKPK